MVAVNFELFLRVFKPSDADVIWAEGRPELFRWTKLGIKVAGSVGRLRTHMLNG